MKRIDAEGHDSNRFTNGNPSLGIPATVLDDSWANNVQEELVNVVLDAGLALNGAVENQVLQALNIILERGGTQYSQTINNNAGATSVTGILFDKLEVKAAHLYFDLFRRTDSASFNETGEMFISHDTENDTWSVYLVSHGDDANVDFQMTAAGQLQYTSNNLAGTGYSSTLRITQVITHAQ